MVAHFLGLALCLGAALSIKQRPIDFSEKRIEMTRAYIKEHYGVQTQTIRIKPQMVVIHWTGMNSLEKSFRAFKNEKIASFRKELTGSSLNVSAHFLIDRDGTIYQLMPDNWMARHVIGLNHTAIGIENVGGEGGKEDLTSLQLKANIALIHHLQKKHPTIQHIIGHLEYQQFEKTSLWKELVPGYRTTKSDPGPLFMKQLREQLGKS